MKQVAWVAFVVMATLTGLVLLWRFNLAIILFLLSLVVASALHPFVSRLVARRMARPAALGVVYAAFLIALIGLFALAAPIVGRELQHVADDAVSGYDRIKMEWPRGGTLLQRMIADQLPPSSEFYAAISTEDGLASALGLLGAAQNMLSALALAGIVIVLSLYWSSDRRRLAHLSLSLLPREQHERVRGALEAAETDVGAYVRGEVVQSVLAGIVLGLLFRLAGIPYPALFALWVAVVRLIPWFGPVLAVLPAVLAVISGAVVPGIASGVLTLAVLFLLRLAVWPRFFDGKRISGLWFLFCIVSLAELGGAAGAMIAPVIALAVQTLAERLVLAPAPQPVPAIADRLETIGARLSELSGGLAANGGGEPSEAQEEIRRLREVVDALAAQVGE